MRTQNTRPPAAGYPPKLKLLIVESAGIATMGVGVWLLVTHNVLGLALVLAGVDLLLRPGARRKPPRVDRLVLRAIDRWRSPPPTL